MKQPLSILLTVSVLATSSATAANYLDATGETINIPAGFGVKVSAGSRLKAAAK